MTAYYILLALAFIIEMAVTPFFLKFQRPGISWKSRTTKMICATMFVAMGFLCFKISENTTEFARFMLFGLIASWFGDLFLHFKKINLVLIGGISFFSAHVIFVLIAFKTKLQIKKIALCGVIPYAVMITTMTIKAISFSVRYFMTGAQSGLLLMLTLSLGAVLFVLSDGSIVFLMFDDRFRKNIPLKNFNIWTYFIGQALLASSILFFA